MSYFKWKSYDLEIEVEHVDGINAFDVAAHRQECFRKNSNNKY